MRGTFLQLVFLVIGLGHALPLESSFNQTQNVDSHQNPRMSINAFPGSDLPLNSPSQPKAKKITKVGKAINHYVKNKQKKKNFFCISHCRTGDNVSSKDPKSQGDQLTSSRTFNTIPDSHAMSMKNVSMWMHVSDARQP